ncbi:helicase-related protein [Paenibacillus thermoaerophilus]|uniref:Helicase-related protein n=1 Tax=Paenibacillus thermoaerophilus TaxID=1215385 RepID=A0ABW2V7Y2_9BACL|nr:helicase-related protein [Paenibacillus thermoaerophilus]TMV12517.1 DNA/RNA helicase [Paenibacillus thermoaerophilus]
MRAWVYAVRVSGENEWTWRYTIDREADRYYWSARGGADVLEIESQVSLGQAVWLGERLQAVRQRSDPKRAFERVIREAALEPWPGGAWLGRLQHEGRFRRIAEGAERSTGWRPPDEGLLRLVERRLEGRSLLRAELEQSLADAGWTPSRGSWTAALQLLALRGRARILGGLEPPGRRPRRGYGRRHRHRGWRCRRCGSGARLHASPCPFCGTDCPYCEACLALGRARFCSMLALGPQGQHGAGTAGRAPQPLYPRPPAERLARWGLSPAQTAAAEAALACLRRGGDAAPSRAGGLGRLGAFAAGFILRLLRIRPFSRAEEPRRFLLWAVTGAGKTEMIFPLLEETLLRGGRAAVASPRRDVILELDPRLRRAFPHIPIAALYGGSEQRWDQAPLTLATTHQLMRFHEAFDLLVLDELDAFPYHNNPMLHYAAAKTVAPGGVHILLSATPPRELRRLADRGRLPHARVPVRYHRHPLPVPRRLRVPPLRRMSALTPALKRQLELSAERGAQIFVFVPEIARVSKVVTMLRQVFPQLPIDGTSSQDPERAAKVARFREREIRMLVTTTILERGVTVPKSDVYILDADSTLFDEAALVQMAGRAGRSAEDPAGLVCFAAAEWTRSQREAIRQIRGMNRLAGRKGYLIRRPSIFFRPGRPEDA